MEIKEFIKPDVIYDIGAGQGMYFRDMITEKNRIVLCDVDNTFDSLWDSAYCGKDYKKCHLFIGERTRRGMEIEFFCNSEHSYYDTACTKMVKTLPKEHYNQRKFYRLVGMDYLLKKYGGKNILVKLDVNGLERDIIRGMSMLPKYIIFVHRCDMVDYTEEILGRLKDYGFYLLNRKEIVSTKKSARELLKYLEGKKKYCVKHILGVRN